ncbi:MAG: zinc ribbon domain-containing protein [Salinivirgaceae bacterium]|jgi:putative FmdB family regulatory protein|nr:zinc ribbon domain-containing protein [Desulfobacterales bacterium]MDY0282568.1 zinc ribbon domain-containing protein [Salinivirgaceae bacterium]
MPIYEFYCGVCHTIYNFFSKTVNTAAVPFCPKCKSDTLTRQVSVFAVTGRASDEADTDMPIDEQKLERAMALLGREAEHINEEDPRQAADLMRKLTDMTGLELGPGMSEALRRMAQGEDPDSIEAEMGDVLESEDPFILPDGKGKTGPAQRRSLPAKDDTLYDLL